MPGRRRAVMATALAVIVRRGNDPRASDHKATVRKRTAPRASGPGPKVIGTAVAGNGRATATVRPPRHRRVIVVRMARVVASRVNARVRKASGQRARGVATNAGRTASVRRPVNVKDVTAKGVVMKVAEAKPADPRPARHRRQLVATSNFEKSSRNFASRCGNCNAPSARCGLNRRGVPTRAAVPRGAETTAPKRDVRRKTTVSRATTVAAPGSGRPRSGVRAWDARRSDVLRWDSGSVVPTGSVSRGLPRVRRPAIRVAPRHGRMVIVVRVTTAVIATTAEKVTTVGRAARVHRTVEAAHARSTPEPSLGRLRKKHDTAV